MASGREKGKVGVATWRSDEEIPFLRPFRRWRAVRAIELHVTDSEPVLKSHSKGSAVDFDLPTNVAIEQG
jgi:hypothetical protein